MKPDADRAAIKAAETLIEYKVTSAPIAPLPILKSLPNVFVASFAEMSDQTGIERQNLITSFGKEHPDAVTFCQRTSDGIRYFIAYNQRLPFYMLHHIPLKLTLRMIGRVFVLTVKRDK